MRAAAAALAQAALVHTMASTIDCSLIREPQLLDLIDEEWARDKLPDDGGC